MKTATYALCGSFVAAAGTVICGMVAYFLGPATSLTALLSVPLLPGCIIGYFFIYGDRGENGVAEFWATAVSLPFWMLIGAYVGAVIAHFAGRPARER